MKMLRSRLFIAIDLPQNIKQALISFQTMLLHETNIDARLVKPEQLHLTLAFLGECTQEQRATVQSALKTIKQEKFQFCLHECGVFPTPEKPRVVWVDVVNGAVHALAKKVHNAVASVVELEDRDFKAHITVARINSVPNSEKFTQFITRVVVPNECFEVVDFVLYSSELTKEGPIYTQVERYPSTNLNHQM